MVRLQRVQVYNGEEESKIETSNGRAVAKASSTHDMIKRQNVSRKDLVMSTCHDNKIEELIQTDIF